MPLSSAARIVVALTLGFAQTLVMGRGAAAQGADVLVRIDTGSPVAHATSLELAQRGLRASYDAEPGALDAVGRAQESRVAALALGARAVVWIDAGADGRSVVVRALRAEDGEQGSSVALLDDVRAEPRLAALVLGALAEEMLARPFRAPVQPAAVVVPEPAVDDSPTATSPELRAYGTFSAGLWGRFDPVFGGGLDVRLSSGAEWRDGLRVGAHVRVLPGSDAARVADQIVTRLATRVVLGGEVVGRFEVPGHALIVGGSVALGPAQRVEASGQDTWDVLLVLGAIVGFSFPVGHRGAEMGVHLGIDALIEPSRGVAPSPSLSLRWDWR